MLFCLRGGFLRHNICVQLPADADRVQRVVAEANLATDDLVAALRSEVPDLVPPPSDEIELLNLMAAIFEQLRVRTWSAD